MTDALGGLRGTLLTATALVFGLLATGCMMSGGHMDSGRDTRSTGVVEAASDTEVRIVNYGFDPGNLRVPAGTTVTWTNLDPVGHTATADAGAFGSPVLGRGESWSFTFTEPGTYTYFCAPHPQMKAQVTVFD